MLFLMATLLAVLPTSDWLNDIEMRVDEQAVHWLREELKKEKGEEDAPSSQKALSQYKPCYLGNRYEEDGPIIRILMSFSVPIESWLALSRPVNGYVPVFVLRGLPESSFLKFGKKVGELRERGVTNSIEINPRMFSENGITHVPVFLMEGGGSSRLLHGNVSLEYALSHLLKKETDHE